LIALIKACPAQHYLLEARSCTGWIDSDFPHQTHTGWGSPSIAHRLEEQDGQEANAARDTTEAVETAAEPHEETETQPPADPLFNLEGLLMDAFGRDHHRLAQALLPIMQGYRTLDDWRQTFRFWEEGGIHVTPVHFYQPIPDTAKLGEAAVSSEMAGIDLRVGRQLELLSLFRAFSAECSTIPHVVEESDDGFFLQNHAFGGTDALVLYCMIRHFRPSKIVEVGSGYSPILASRALKANGSGTLTCIEPYPPSYLPAELPHLDRIVAQPVQEVDLELFTTLRSGDILFIDSSHVSKWGSDVNHLFLEVLPRLAPGVIVHVHDIFLPEEFPVGWIRDHLLFWNEQYLLRAFLAFNSEYEVLLANHYLGRHHQGQFREALPSAGWWGGGSFWIRRNG
jgi:hypothetical protein